ncbi:MAG: glycoside hydrolase family 88 protein [Clostridia bacterium]|nr:glycoside hydrolase family 88 protein [Clostridia bacterium]
MMGYIELENSAAVFSGNNTEKVIRLLADRYCSLNPAEPYVWRSFDESGIQADKKAVYHFDFDRRFPKAEIGDYAVAIGDLFCPSAKGSAFLIACKNPVKLYLNRELVFQSNGAKERSGEKDRVQVTLHEGINRFVIVAEKTKLGFYCMLQNAMPQWEPCNYIMPFEEREGEAGFVYQLFPCDAPMPEEAALWGEKELLSWLPVVEEKPLKEDGLFSAAAVFELDEDRNVTWQKAPDVQMWVDEKEATGLLKKGEHTLHMFGTLAGIHAVRAEGVALHPPVPVHGRCTPYLVAGPMDKCTFMPVGTVAEGEMVWRPALEGMALRPYVETNLFGKWTYPLGVTLYGMKRAAEKLQDKKMLDYVLSHVKQVTGISRYAAYDTEKYGFAGVNQQLCWLDALDDCGSFGALMLRCDPRGEDPDVRRLADKIGHYMLHEQPCTKDGAFQRRDDTVWADDMYMSVPFLCRYGEMTGDSTPLDFAAKQMLHYKKLLFMPEKNVMAHMRCLQHGLHNGIPWSRGNGWVIFSLSELLQVLPKEHGDREKLIAFFRELTAGYLALQDETGMWHQVLDDKKSYLETSATAMFICAFMRGFRGGWYEQDMAESAKEAAYKAWKGITENAIDREGNLYGVCRGSGFSFSRNYYRSLSWNFNDTHGIGIVMLAGVELMN